MQLSGRTRAIIEKIYQGRPHMELTLGRLEDGEAEVLRLGPAQNPLPGPGPCYAVGSIAKPFTASLLAKYLAECKMDLDAPLSQYIQPLPQRYYPSLRRLATHTSGYGGQPYTFWPALKMFIRMNKPDGLFRTNPYHGMPDEAGMFRILGETRLEDREYKYAYSNFGMGVLGYALGTITGEGYWHSMQRFIREELGLPRTRLGVTEEVTGYDKKNQPCTNWQWDAHDIIAAAGALVAPVEDLLSFARQNLDGSKPYLDICHQRLGPGDAKKKFASGLAWRLPHGTAISWHTGAAGAYGAFIGMNREKKTAVAAACNYGLVDMKDLGLSMLT